ncbi:MAG: hypothetical protein K6F37_06630 [Lachnospiraceae bacterium]|nr:hypothetical protein [Lachnospiraceae bacterium]
MDKEKGTFVVHVLGTENATWQGNVLWADRDESTNFRSTLELIKLIDGALEDSEKKS